MVGTRSLTTFNDEYDNEEIVVLYRQYDGYPQGHGKELFEFLNEMVVVNGISLNGPPKIANGMSCLTAQAVSHFKGSEVGGVYLYKSGTRDIGELYIYTIYVVCVVCVWCVYMVRMSLIIYIIHVIYIIYKSLRDRWLYLYTFPNKFTKFNSIL